MRRTSRSLREISIGNVASKIALHLAFEEDVIAALLSRWVSELEPVIVRSQEGWILGLSFAADFGAPLCIRFADLRLEDIREHYERRRRMKHFPLRAVED